MTRPGARRRRLALRCAAMLSAGPLLASGAALPERMSAGSPADAAGPELVGEAVQGALLAGRLPAGLRDPTLDGRPVPVAADGRFVLGLDRDAGAFATLGWVDAAGIARTRTLAVAPRAWAISRLPGLPRTPLPDAEFARVRPAELAAIAAARATATDAQGWRQRFRWPLTGRISTLFGAQRVYAGGEAGAYHTGIDIARPTGTPVLAPADGVVTLVADHPFALEGNLLIVDHGSGLDSAFMHLSRIDVAVGDHVRQGQPIALVGATGRATGPHLHWGLRWRGARLDPLLIAGAMPGG